MYSVNTSAIMYPVDLRFYDVRSKVNNLVITFTQTHDRMNTVQFRIGKTNPVKPVDCWVAEHFDQHVVKCVSSHNIPLSSHYTHAFEKIKS